MHNEVITLFEGISNTTMTAYLHDVCLDHRFVGRRPAVIICPGGAYLGITEKEAEPVALRFLAAGYHAFVLRYSIGAGMARFPAPFIDVGKAVLMLRENSERWGIDPDKITLCGFSAGGHVAAMFSATWQEAYIAKALNANNQLYKPNALILCYPVLDFYRFGLKNKEKSQELQVLTEMIFNAIYGQSEPDDSQIHEWGCIDRASENMPPTFVWGTWEDNFADADQLLDFVKKLKAYHVPCELHIFDKGAHGLSLGDHTVGLSDSERRNIGNTAEWFNLAISWLHRQYIRDELNI